jgi:predicted DNA-binding transcriptional regulator AlpA
MTEDELLTVEELAKFLKLSPRTIYNKIAQGNIESGTFKPLPFRVIRIGKRIIRFSKKEVYDFISDC